MKFKKNKPYIFNDLISDNLRASKNFFIFHLIFFACGLILGFVFSANVNANFFAMDYTNRYYNIVFNKSLSIVSIFFDRVLINLQLFFLILIFSLHFSMTPLHYVFIMYKSYVLSSVTVVIISTYGVLGIANCILLILPQQLITLFLLICFSLYGMRAAFNFRRYRGYVDFKGFIGRCLCYYLLSLITVVLDIVLIYIIIRPFNLLI